MGITRPARGECKTVKAFLSNDYLTLLLRILLGLAFVVASTDKIADPSAFAVSIGNYKLLPPLVALIAATIIPWAELLCGLGLIFGISWRGSTLLAFVMLAVFTLAVGIAMARGLDISCGCFTRDPGAGKVGWLKIGENLLMLASSALIFYSNGGRFSLEQSIRQHAFQSRE